MTNLQTILTSIVLSSSVVGAILFLFKRTIETGIKTKFKEIENKQRLNLEEKKRRQGKLFDDQYEMGKSILALTYRVRNCSRDITDELNKVDYSLQFVNQRFKIQNNYYESLETLLLDNRAILPEVLFNEVHELKHRISSINNRLYILLNEAKPLKEEEMKNFIDKIKRDYAKIEEHYAVMTAIVQSSLGVNN